MGRDDAWPEGDRGDVFVAVFDLDWRLIEEVRLTQYETNAAMRPWIACHQELCLVSFDVDTTHAVVPFSIDYTNGGSSGSTNAKIDECGCGSSGTALLLLPVVFAFRRRGRGSISAAANPLVHNVSLHQ